MKDWPIVKWFGVLISAVLFGLAAGATARRNAKSRALQRAAGENAASEARNAQERAARQTLAADKERRRAAAARARAEARLDEIGASDETLGDMVNNWNTDRLRNG